MTEERKEQIANNILWFVIEIIAGVVIGLLGGGF